MSHKHLPTPGDCLAIDFYYEEYEKRYARQCPANYKEVFAIMMVSTPKDDDMMLYMLDRVGQPGWRGDKNLCPHFPDLPRK